MRKTDLQMYENIRSYEIPASDAWNNDRLNKIRIALNHQKREYHLYFPIERYTKILDYYTIEFTIEWIIVTRKSDTRQVRYPRNEWS